MLEAGFDYRLHPLYQHTKSIAVSRWLSRQVPLSREGDLAGLSDSWLVTLSGNQWAAAGWKSRRELSLLSLSLELKQSELLVRRWVSPISYLIHCTIISQYNASSAQFSQELFHSMDKCIRRQNKEIDALFDSQLLFTSSVTLDK